MKWLNRYIDNHAIRDETEPNKPVLSLNEQPLWLRFLIKLSRRVKNELRY